MSTSVEAQGLSGSSLGCAFVIFTNVASEAVLGQVARAEAELAGQCDVHVIGYFPDAAAAPAPFGSDPRFHAYDRARMEAMGYPLKGRAPFRLMPGNTDMPVLAFARDNPGYATIWLFENDVAFTGPLSSLLEAFARSPADLLTTSIAPPAHDWAHSAATVLPKGWGRAGGGVEGGDASWAAGWAEGLPLRAFLPAFRASRRLLDEVERFYREGGDGHYEQVWPTVAQVRGLVLEDFGGDGRFVRPGNRNRFYTSTPQTAHLYPGTFRFRPARQRPGQRPMTLWHPVKEDLATSLQTRAREHLRLTGRWLLPHRLRRWLKGLWPS